VETARALNRKSKREARRRFSAEEKLRGCQPEPGQAAAEKKSELGLVERRSYSRVSCGKKCAMIELAQRSPLSKGTSLEEMGLARSIWRRTRMVSSCPVLSGARTTGEEGFPKMPSSNTLSRTLR